MTSMVSSRGTSKDRTRMSPRLAYTRNFSRPGTQKSCLVMFIRNVFDSQIDRKDRDRNTARGLKDLHKDRDRDRQTWNHKPLAIA